jgi:4-phytase/acid phosphatase
MDQVGWGRASKADIQAMLRFHTVKFLRGRLASYVAERYAAPIAKEILLAALNGEADTGPAS